jgi:hypothetical protein
MYSKRVLSSTKSVDYSLILCDPTRQILDPTQLEPPIPKKNADPDQSRVTVNLADNLASSQKTNRHYRETVELDLLTS